MAIYRLLQNSGFAPEDIERMQTSYEEALKILKLADRSDPITETVARHIIEIAQTGVTDPATLCTMALERINEGDYDGALLSPGRDWRRTLALAGTAVAISLIR